MYGQQPIPQQEEESPFADIRRKIMQSMMMAQNSIPAGMQKHYIDQKLFGPAQTVSTEPQGQPFKGQVGTTTLSPEDENKLRMLLKQRDPSLTPAQINSMILRFKEQKGLR